MRRVEAQAMSRPERKSSSGVGIPNPWSVGNVPGLVTAPDQTRGRRLGARVRRVAIDLTPLRRSRDFRLLWFGELVSQFGSQITLVALFVQVYALTNSAAAVGLVGLVQLGPMVLVSIGFGPQIDLRDRRLLLFFAQLGLGVASAILLLGAVIGSPPVWLLYFAAALNAAFMSISMPTRSAMVPTLVGADLLPAAGALNQVMWNGAAVAGPALGGIVVATAGLRWAYGIDVASFAFALGASFLLHSQVPIRPEGDEPERGFAAIMTGLRFLKGRPVLQSTFTVDIVAMVFGMPRVLFPVLAVQQFHRGADA